jgi:hypothetical protein
MWKMMTLSQGLGEWWELILSVLDIWFLITIVSKLGSCCILMEIITLSLLLKAIISSFHKRDKHDDRAIV